MSTDSHQLSFPVADPGSVSDGTDFTLDNGSEMEDGGGDGEVDADDPGDPPLDALINDATDDGEGEDDGDGDDADSDESGGGSGAAAPAIPDNARIEVPTILKVIPDKLAYHAVKHNVFLQCRQAMETALESYTAAASRDYPACEACGRDDGTTEMNRAGSLLMGFQRNLLAISASLEGSLDPVKMKMTLEHLLAEFMKSTLTAISAEMNRLKEELVPIRSTQREVREKATASMVEAFKRMGAHLTVEHDDLKRQLSAMVGANQDEPKKKGGGSRRPGSGPPV